MNKVSFPDNCKSTNMIEWYLLYFWIVLTIKFKMTGQNGSQNWKTEKKMFWTRWTKQRNQVLITTNLGPSMVTGHGGHGHRLNRSMDVHFDIQHGHLHSFPRKRKKHDTVGYLLNHRCHLRQIVCYFPTNFGTLDLMFRIYLSVLSDDAYFLIWDLRGVEWVHDLFLFPLILGKMKLPHAKLGLFCVV